MYGDMLAPQGPMGAPPPIAPPPMQQAAPQGPALQTGPSDQQAQIPGPLGSPPHGHEEAKLAAYNAHQAQFLKQLAADYALGRISKEDLKKGASYSGLQPYHQWKNDNVIHLKAMADAEGE